MDKSRNKWIWLTIIAALGTFVFIIRPILLPFITSFIVAYALSPAVEKFEKYKINPKGMIDLFEILQKEHSVNIPGFLSTHPVTSDRITYIKKHIKNHPFSFTPHPELMQLLTKAKTQMSN